MRRPRRSLALSLAIALVVAVVLSPAAGAQDPSAPDGCTLLTATEVDAAFGVTGVESTGAGGFCTFSGPTTLIVAIVPGSDLEAQKQQYPDGVEATIAGNPAWIAESARTIVVNANGQVLGISYYGDVAWAEALPALMGLVELAIPRVPAGPSPEDIARVKALLPSTIDGEPLTVQSFGGEMLLGFLDQSAPPVIALREALAAQGKTPADILFVGGETESEEDYGATAVLVKGADAAGLLTPLMEALASDSGAATFEAREIGGKQVTVVTTDEILYVYPIGDILVGINAPDDELEAIFAALP